MREFEKKIDEVFNVNIREAVTTATIEEGVVGDVKEFIGLIKNKDFKGVLELFLDKVLPTIDLEKIEANKGKIVGVVDGILKKISPTTESKETIEESAEMAEFGAQLINAAVYGVTGMLAVVAIIYDYLMNDGKLIGSASGAAEKIVGGFISFCSSNKKSGGKKKRRR
jgi:hypothetical protein